MSLKFNTLVHSIITAGDALQTQCKSLTALAKAMPFAQYRNELAQAVGAFYKTEPHESRKGKLLTFAKESAAEQKLSVLVKLHPDWRNTGGVSNAKREPIVAPASLVSNVTKEIIEAGLTKMQFNALIHALREAIVFE
jgi:hypothetical protein